MSDPQQARIEAAAVNALFHLVCGCTLDGCHDSQPARYFAQYGPTGCLYCVTHGWVLLTDVVSLALLTPFPNEEPSDA